MMTAGAPVPCQAGEQDAAEDVANVCTHDTHDVRRVMSGESRGRRRSSLRSQKHRQKVCPHFTRTEIPCRREAIVSPGRILCSFCFASFEAAFSDRREGMVGPQDTPFAPFACLCLIHATRASTEMSSFNSPHPPAIQSKGDSSVDVAAVSKKGVRNKRAALAAAKRR